MVKELFCYNQPELVKFNGYGFWPRFRLFVILRMHARGVRSVCWADCFRVVLDMSWTSVKAKVSHKKKRIGTASFGTLRIQNVACSYFVTDVPNVACGYFVTDVPNKIQRSDDGGTQHN